jgi:predicted transcriptional regulator
MSSDRQKVKFTTQADPRILSLLQGLARAEGRQLQAVIDEALREYAERKKEKAVRSHVMIALDASLSQYDDLYQRLAQ